MTVDVSYEVVLPARDVLARQPDHCAAVAAYLRRECAMHDDTGLLLALLAPMARGVLELGVQATTLAGRAGTFAAQQVQESVTGYLEAERQAHERLNGLAGRLGAGSTPWTDPTAGVPPLGPPRSGAPDGYGEAGRWFVEDVQGTIDTVRQMADGTGRLGRDVAGWTGPAGAVAEQTDPTSYLVPPDLGTNEVQELRWSAGVVLGGIDWLAEQVLGFSILEEVVFKPFGGDFQGIKRASAGWGHTASAFTGVAENYAGLTSSTLTGWQGAAGEAFRAAMVAAAGAHVALSQAALYVSGLASNVALVSQAACIGIGMILKKISEKLIRMAAEAAVPVIGWAVAAGEAVILIQDVIAYVRLAYSIIEGIVDVINGFVEGQAQMLQSLGVMEDLVEYLGRRAVA